MAATSARLQRRIRSDFDESDVGEILERLQSIPESLPLGRSQDPERLQSALVLTSGGDLNEFRAMLELGHVDWRDLLVSAGLADADWQSELDRLLGPV